MRAATAASAREPRGERTLMGIGPEFIRREVISDEVSGTLDGVPHERMDRTPSSPIVVEPQAVAPSPTVRMPVPSTARTVQLSLAPAATIQLPMEEALPPGSPSRRLDSVVSGGFFREGERQEANNWEDSPLVDEPFPDEVPPKISSFDRVPRRHGPLIVTSFLLATALVVGVVMHGAGTRAMGAWLAAEAGPRALEVWNRAKTGLTMRLTPESTAASARAMAAPVSAPSPEVPTAQATVAVSKVSPPSTPPAATPAAAEAPSTEDLWAPLVAATPAPPPAMHLTRRAEENTASDRATSEAVARRFAPSRHAVTTARAIEERSAAADETARASADVSADESSGPSAAPRHGLVWSPSEQRLVPVQPASVDLSANSTQPRTAATDSVGKSADKDVLPLDDDAHTTY